MLKSKFFRIAVEGDTTDGRDIDRKWLEDMAASYNPEKYTALINIEHMRGYGPNSDFGNYGKVLALKTEEIEVDGEKRLALLGQINPNSNLLALNERGQKLFTSVEIQPDFAGKEQAYLVGLAVTDSPASLSTEMLEFSSKAKTNPLSARKLSPDNILSAALEAELEFTDDSKEGEPTLLSKVKALFSKTNKQQTENFADVHSAVEEIAGAVSDLQNKFSEYDCTAKKFDELAIKLSSEEKINKEFREKIENTDFNFQRPPAAGGDGVVTTDC
ncbi:MAG: GPO family capsid scaffolding protein [Oceanospirillaceae bacterium]|nr:GPO family capsid scaffolding protein [Oceanospirillaceae bacterium]